MRRHLPVALALTTVSALLLAAPLPPATGRALDASNRFAPSGVVSVDPSGTTRTAKTLGTAAVPLEPGIAGTSGCRDAASTNVRINQDCTNQSTLLGRSQSQNEPAIAVNPLDPDNIVAGQNDYRAGDAACGADFSLDGGKHWGSGLVPMRFTSPGLTADRHYWDASGDPSVAFDSRGEAYYMCLAFDRGEISDLGGTASGIFLFRSGDGGASWSFPAVPVAQTTGTGDIALIDKPYMTVDAHPASPNRDRIYVAWIQYGPEFTAARLFFAFSDDHGASWHQSGNIVANSRLCPVNFNNPTLPFRCNANQFPQPFVAPNGDVYVTFQNFNNCNGVNPACDGAPDDNHNQILIVKSTDGGTTFGPPVKVSDFYELPDCVTYTGFDFGVPCLPTAPLSARSIFRAFNYPVGVARSSSRIVVTLASYINRHSNPARGNCAPAGISPDTFLNRYEGVGEVDGCNNDIVVSVSTDGGGSFSGTNTPVHRLRTMSDERPGGQLADQWWQWADVTPSRGAVVVYYDRKYGLDMRNGFMDLTLRRSDGARVRVTNRSLPPSNEFPAGEGSQSSTFLGDYSGLAVGRDGVAHAVWADTRNPIFTFSDIGDPRTPIPAGFGADIYTRSLRG